MKCSACLSTEKKREEMSSAYKPLHATSSRSSHHVSSTRRTPLNRPTSTTRPFAHWRSHRQTVASAGLQRQRVLCCLAFRACLAFVDSSSRAFDCPDCPCKCVEYQFRTKRKVPKLGLMLVGWGGNNGSTCTAGILANKVEIEWETKHHAAASCAAPSPRLHVRLGGHGPNHQDVHVPFFRFCPWCIPTTWSSVGGTSQR